MKHEITQIAAQTGLTAYVSEEMASGYFKGYAFLIHRDVRNRRYTIRCWATSRSEENSQQLGGWLQEYHNTHPYYQNGFYDGRIVSLVTVLDSKQRQPSLDAVMQLLFDITYYLAANGFYSACSQCGSTHDIAIYQMGGGYSHLCRNCFSSISNGAVAQQSQIKGNPLLGILGAMLFSLAGVALWVIFKQMNIYASITGLVTIACAFQGYKTFGKKLDRPGVILCCIISLLAGCLAVCIDCGIAIAAHYGVGIVEAVMAAPYLLFNGYFPGEIWSDIGIAFLFMFIGGFSIAKNAFAEAKTGFAHRKLAERQPEMSYNNQHY